MFQFHPVYTCHLKLHTNYNGWYSVDKSKVALLLGNVRNQVDGEYLSR